MNWPVHCFDITGCQHLTISGVVLNNTAGDEPNSASGDDAAAHNSDGFDISSSDYVTLENIEVYNQDDCVAVTSGTQIVVDNIYCSGGHGLSIGSIGGKSNNTVDGITFKNSQVVNSENGCRIKSNADTTGSVSNPRPINMTIKGDRNSNELNRSATLSTRISPCLRSQTTVSTSNRTISMAVPLATPLTASPSPALLSPVLPALPPTMPTITTFCVVQTAAPTSASPMFPLLAVVRPAAATTPPVDALHRNSGYLLHRELIVADRETYCPCTPFFYADTCIDAVERLIYLSRN